MIDLAIWLHSRHSDRPECRHLIDTRSTIRANGVLEIVDTPEGERMQLTPRQTVPGLAVKVVIDRVAGPENLLLAAVSNNPTVFISDMAPAEPHEFKAELQLAFGGDRAAFAFEMKEPVGHHH